MNKLLEILKSIRPECNFSKSKDFIKDRLLDSLDIIVLISALEGHYGIFIDGEEVTPQNFKNLRAIERFMQRHLNSKRHGSSMD